MARLLQVAVGLLVVVLLLAAGAGWKVADTARQKRAEAQEHLAADWKRYEPRVLADEARWKDDPLLGAHPGADANPLFLSHLRFDKDPDGKQPLTPELREAIRTAEADWAKKADELDLSGVDTGWLSGLDAYSYWDIESAGPLDGMPFALLTEPLPQFSDLQVLAKAHLLKGLKSGSAVQAGKDVHELARLCLTTETLLGSMVGTSLLVSERRAFEEAVARGQDVAGWAPVSEADRLTLVALLWSSPSPHGLLATEPLASHRIAPGECTGLREGAGMAFFLRGYLQDELPARYAAYEQALERTPCRLRRLKLAWKSADPGPGQLPVKGSALCMEEAGVEAASCVVPNWVVSVPFARGYIGNNLAVLGAPDWFKKYREP